MAQNRYLHCTMSVVFVHVTLLFFNFPILPGLKYGVFGYNNNPLKNPNTKETTVIFSYTKPQENYFNIFTILGPVSNAIKGIRKKSIKKYRGQRLKI